MLLLMEIDFVLLISTPFEHISNIKKSSLSVIVQGVVIIESTTRDQPQTSLIHL